MKIALDEHLVLQTVSKQYQSLSQLELGGKTIINNEPLQVDLAGVQLLIALKKKTPSLKVKLEIDEDSASALQNAAIQQIIEIKNNHIEIN